MASRPLILLLDDDAAFRQLTSQLLVLSGYGVIEARTVSEAEQVLPTENFALAVVDYLLPGVDGITFIERVRASGNSIPIVFLSGNWCGDPQMYKRLRYALTVDLILRKPIIPELFIEQIETILKAPMAKQAVLIGSAMQSESGASTLAKVTDDSAHSPETPSNQLASAFDGDADPAELIIGDEAPAQQLSKFRQKLRLEETVNKARVEYGKSLPDKVAELKTKIDKLELQPNDRIISQDAIRQAHTFIGTAGSLRFQHVSSLAGAIESLLTNQKELSEKEPDQFKYRLHELSDQLQEAAYIAAGACNVPESRKLCSGKILAIGDFHTFAELSRSLAEEGLAEVTFFPHGTESDITPEQRYHCVIVEDKYKSGEECLNLIKNLRSTAAIGIVPILVLSDRSEWPSATSLYAGVQEILSRSIQPLQLQSLVMEILSANESCNAKVLIIDDDPALTDFISSVLGAYNITVNALNEPIGILEEMEKCQPDLLLLDIIMPGMSGYDVCRMLRENEKWHALPIVCITAKNSPEAREAALRAGADDILGKPVLINDLLNRVSICLESPEEFRQRRDIEPTSGLISRTSFEARVQQFMNEKEGHNGELALGFLAIESPAAGDSESGAGARAGSKSGSGSGSESEPGAGSDGSASGSPAKADKENASGQRIESEIAALLNERFRAKDIRSKWDNAIFALAFPQVDPTQAKEALGLMVEELQHNYGNSLLKDWNLQFWVE